MRIGFEFAELMLLSVALNWNTVFSLAGAALISPRISIVAQVGIAPSNTPSKTHSVLAVSSLKTGGRIRPADCRNVSNCISLTIHSPVNRPFTFFQSFVQGHSNHSGKAIPIIRARPFQSFGQGHSNHSGKAVPIIRARPFQSFGQGRA
jgi:hypothetical protein